MVTSSSDVLITTKNGYYKYNLNKLEFKPMFYLNTNTTYSIVRSMAFSDDRLTRLEIRCNSNHDTFICELKNEHIRLTLKKIHSHPDFSEKKLLISRDGRIGVISMMLPVAEIWDLYNQKHLRDIKGNDFLLSDNGEILLSIDNCTIYLWDVASGRLLTKLNHEKLNFFSSIAMSKDGKIIIAHNNDFICYWRVS